MKKKLKIAINGLGRIGRAVLRAYQKSILQNHRVAELIEIVAINFGQHQVGDRLHALKYDSVHGVFSGMHALDDQSFTIGSGTKIQIIQERSPQDIDWSKFSVDIVLECSGAFNTREKSVLHLDSGAKSVLVSAPCAGADATIVVGVNDHILKMGNHKVISLASCTTNCLAPIAKALHDDIGIQAGFITTVHSYTNDQSLLDSSHKDRRRARAANLSMIPTSTGAAKSIGLVIPELEGKLDGAAIRVPVPNVSMIDLKFTSCDSTTIDKVNSCILKASEQNPRVIAYSDEELVSVDFLGNSSSTIFDATQTKVVKDNFCRVVAWYDNEFGFASRMLDLAAIMSAHAKLRGM